MTTPAVDESWDRLGAVAQLLHTAGLGALELLTAAEELTRPLPMHRADLAGVCDLVVDLCDLIREARSLGC
ncbi:MAG TPA: hypothetical protein VF062_24930 [Candidatus Limnocylindrales bacterium]